jgi:hypothetical protein
VQTELELVCNLAGIELANELYRRRKENGAYMKWRKFLFTPAVCSGRTIL